MQTPAVQKTWVEKVEDHRASLLRLRTQLARLKSSLPGATSVLSDTATAFSGAAAAVEEWSSDDTQLLAAAKTLASLLSRHDDVKDSLRATTARRPMTSKPRSKSTSRDRALPDPVDFSLFTRARWEAERRKGEAMLAGEGDAGVQVYDKELPKPVPKEKACNQVRGRHVLVNNVEKAKKIYLELAVTGTMDRQGFLRHCSSARFASLATERSECPTGAAGGDLGWLSREEKPSRLQEVAFVTPRSACSPPFRSGSGFHLFYCEERR